MMYQWAEDMIRFMRDASEYGDYNQKLAEMMRPWLTKDSHICDAGCGLGYLALALAPYAGKVTAMDKNADALRVLRKNCESRKISNVTIQCGDISEWLPEQPFDSMAFCFFGNIDEILTIAGQRCRGTVFAIKKNYAEHRFSVGSHRGGNDSYANAIRRLQELKIPHEGTAMELEFGQPFRSFEDARCFFETYSCDNDPALITDAFLREKLRETGEPDFPYYLPHRRKVGWLKFEMADVPDHLRT